MRDGPSYLDAELAGLSPAYFGMVMATGIISIDAQLFGWPLLARALLGLNVASAIGLWLLLFARLLRHPRRVGADLVDHLRSVGFFTLVAGTSIVGAQLLLISSALAAAVAVWVLAALLWLGLTYTIFTALTVKPDKPELAHGISGGWLLAVVATQSIAVLGSLLAAHLPQPFKLEINFIALSMWLWGGMLYIWMMSLIFYRYTFFRFSPADLSPPYWINMGAMAISTLAGAQLITNAPDAPFLQSLLPFLKGFTVFYWATGTWWIPMLLVLAVWRHAWMRFPLRYDPAYWGAVFPLGMYAACMERLTDVLQLTFLSAVPQIFFIVAILAWTAAFVGFARDAGRRMSTLSRLPWRRSAS